MATQRSILTAYEFVRGGDYSKPWNVTTIHTQFIRKDHVPKFVRYQMMMLSSAVNRISRGGAKIGPKQRVTPFEGLKAMTAWVAEQYGEQDMTAGMTRM